MTLVLTPEDSDSRMKDDECDASGIDEEANNQVDRVPVHLSPPFGWLFDYQVLYIV